MAHIIYFFAIIILTSGLFIMLTSDNYVRKIIGLGVFQSSVLIFYIALAKVDKGIVPINHCIEEINQKCNYIYSNPLPHVLMLTAIVVGFANLSVGFSLISRISKQFGTVSENMINCSAANDNS